MIMGSYLTEDSFLSNSNPSFKGNWYLLVVLYCFTALINPQSDGVVEQFMVFLKGCYEMVFSDCEETLQ